MVQHCHYADTVRRGCCNEIGSGSGSEVTHGTAADLKSEIHRYLTPRMAEPRGRISCGAMFQFVPRHRGSHLPDKDELISYQLAVWVFDHVLTID